MRGTVTQIKPLDSDAAMPKSGGMALGSQEPQGISFLWPVGVVAAVLYLSVLPLRINLAAITASTFFGLDRLAFATPTLDDMIVNLAVYVPVGFFLALYGLGRSASRVRCATLAFLVAAGLSITVEVLQTGIAERVPSWWDVIFNAIGSAVGVAGSLVCSRRVDTLAMRWNRAPIDRKWRTVAKLLTVGLFAYHLAPFDFVTSTQALHAAFRHAHISLSQPHLGALLPELGAAMFFALLGFATALGMTSRGSRPGAVLASATLYGIAVAGGIEVLQLFTASHVFDLASFALRAVGVVIGVWAGAFIFTDNTALQPRHPSHRSLYHAALLGALIVQVLLLGANLDWSCLTQPGSDAAATTVLPLEAKGCPIALAVGDGGDAAAAAVLPLEALWRAPIHLAVTDMAAILITYGLLTLTLALVLMSRKRSSALPITCLSVSLGSLLLAQLSSMSSSAPLDITKPLLATVAAFAAVEILRSAPLRIATALR